MRLRPVTVEDANLLLEWRNDPVVRAASRSTDEVTPTQHEVWITRMLESPRAWLFIGLEHEDQAVGHTRVVEEGTYAEVSIVVAPEHRGRGLGRQLLTLTHDAYATGGGGLGIRAFVRAHNEPSHRLFRSVGYIVDEQTDVGTWYLWSDRD